MSRILDQWSPLLHLQLLCCSITRLPTSLIPHYRRYTWLRLNFVTPLETLTPHMQQPGWLPGYMLFTNVLKHDFHDCWYFLFSYASRFDFLFLFFFAPHARGALTVHAHGSCTHSRSCLYMWGYFQTEPVKDIQPVVNTGFEGGVSVFYLSCLFTGAFPASLRAREINDRWRQFDRNTARGSYSEVSKYCGETSILKALHISFARNQVCEELPK